MHLQTLLRRTRKRLEPIAGLDRRAPERIAQSLLGLTDAGLRLHTGELPDDFLARFEDAVTRLEQAEPLQYVLGYWEFCGFMFKTDARALIPREETELLVDWAYRALPEGCDTIDIGCGCGAIGIALKLRRPDLRLTLADISADALALARENAAALHADVTCIQADMRLPFPRLYGAVLSNPPYIGAQEYKDMDESVRLYEPKLALYAPEDGYGFYNALRARIADSLAPRGFIAAECGWKQAERIRALWRDARIETDILYDMAGIGRAICGRKG